MDESERQAVRESVERWRRVGPELEAIRRRELRGCGSDERRRLSDDLLGLAAAHAKPRRTSGLSKLYRLLRKPDP